MFNDEYLVSGFSDNWDLLLQLILNTFCNDENFKLIFEYDEAESLSIINLYQSNNKQLLLNKLSDIFIEQNQRHYDQIWGDTMDKNYSDDENPTAQGLVKSNLPKIKYTAIDKKTYDTDNSGLEFSIEINGISAKGFWSPTGQYTPGGVDVNELKIGQYKTIRIFSNGGGNRHYEIYSAPKKLDKQPKDLRFTGEFYSTLNLGDEFKKKIIQGINGTFEAQLTKEFLEYFKLIK